MNQKNSVLSLLLLLLLLTSCSSYGLSDVASMNKRNGTYNVTLRELLTDGVKYHKKKVVVRAYLYQSPIDGARSLIEKKIDDEYFAPSKTTIFLWAQKKERKLIRSHKNTECIKITGDFEHFALAEFVTTIDTNDVTGMINVEKVGRCEMQ